MRRILVSFGLAALLTLTLAGAALGAHCINESKQPGAGTHTVVLIDPTNPSEPIIIGANPAGQAPGGFADVYLDADLSGTLTEADVLLETEIFLISNRTHKDNPAQGIPGVLPPISAERDPGGEGHGVGVRQPD